MNQSSINTSSAETHRLTLISPSLEFGGAERVIAMMANHWVAAGHHVSLMTLSSAETDTYSLDPAVERVALDVMRDSGNLLTALWNNRKRIRRLREAIVASRPDVVISFTETTNILTLLACKGLNLNVVISERTNPIRHSVGKIWSWLRKRTYPRCGALVVQTERVREVMLPIVRGRPIVVIPNAVEVSRRSVQIEKKERGNGIIAMGRLSREKGFDLLIEAFSRVSEKHPSWRVQILGEGSERNNLNRLIHEKKLEQRVTLAGWVPDPTAALACADLFVLPSRYEGFPNSLLEAMASGLPVVGFDCDFGPNEIIRNEIDGLLVPAEDVEALAQTLDRLMSDAALREQYGKQAGEITERFSAEKFFERWETVLQKP